MNGTQYCLLFLFLWLQPPPAIVPKTDLVEVKKVVPTAQLDLRYATTNNFTHQKVYRSSRCFLTRGTAEKLKAVALDLQHEGLGLKIYDGYRPLAVQKRVWALVPDERYVADPKKGSRHNRGAAVDLTLVNLETGKELTMPTGFDDFSERAHRDYDRLPQPVLENRRKLQESMEARGFIGMPTEWWHFDDTNWQKYPILDISIETLP